MSIQMAIPAKGLRSKHCASAAALQAPPGRGRLTFAHHQTRWSELQRGARQLPLLSKCLSISAAFPRIIASCIAPARSAPGGMLRALSRAAVALTFSLQVSDG
jgi:hypothetical protein